ncbi:hypothetical protein BDV11DRAFT_205380 [Aspergillus similis]
MDQENPQTGDLFIFGDSAFGFYNAEHGLPEDWAVPPIIGPGPDPTSSVGLPNGYTEPQPNSYRQNRPSQAYLNPNSGQNWSTGVHVYASTVSTTQRPELQEALTIVNELIPPHQGREQNGYDEDKQFQCKLCKQQRVTCKNRGTFKRHITTTHYPNKQYFCPICIRGSSPISFSRKDKHLLHVRQHGRPKMSREEMEEITQHIPPPQECAIADCRRPTSTWEDFIDCLCRHCAISDDEDQDDGSDRDDGDDDDNNEDDGNGGGNQWFSQSGNGNYGNVSNGTPYGRYSDDQFGGFSGRNGTNPHQYRDAANGTYLSFKKQSSQVLGLKDVPTGPGRAGITQPKSTFTGLKYPQPHTKKTSAVSLDNENLCPETSKVEVSLRFGSSVRKHRGDLGMKELQEKPGSEKQAVNEVSRELQRLRYFETCVFENQRQGSLLTYVYETFVVTQHGHFEQVIESSMQTTRRASPRKRAHLRVRVKAIAGMLALRAAVTKAPLATDNAEVGDGWELGIPYPAQDDAFKVLAWLVQVLVFFLRMPPNPKVYLMRLS